MMTDKTRRGFLESAAIATASLASLKGAEPAAEKAGEIRLGVASYSLRQFQRGLAIRMLRQLGISNLSVKEFHLPYSSTPKEVARGVEDFRRAGVTVTSGGVVYLLEDDDADMRRYFEYAKACGMPMLIVGPARATLPRMEKLVKEYGIAAAIHNHGPEDKHFPTPESALEAIKDMDPRVGVCIDVGHTTRAGGDPVKSIEAAGPRLLDVHIKDLRDLREKGSDVPVGDGAMPIVPILKTLRARNYQGVVHLEYEIDQDAPLPGMMKSFAYLRGALAALASA
jgi:sugar phosphate isomerase/epimerase